MDDTNVAPLTMSSSKYGIDLVCQPSSDMSSITLFWI